MQRAKCFLCLKVQLQIRATSRQIFWQLLAKAIFSVSRDSPPRSAQADFLGLGFPPSPRCRIDEVTVRRRRRNQR